MGNKFTFVFLFSAFILFSNLSYAQFTDLGQQAPVGPQYDGSTGCLGSGVWNASTKTCKIYGFSCTVSGVSDAAAKAYQDCFKSAVTQHDMCTMANGGQWNAVTKTCSNASTVTTKSCSVSSTQQMHCKVGGGTNCAESEKEAHCVCKYSATENGPIGEYVRDSGVGSCPDKAPGETVATAGTMDESVLSCIADIKSQINACKAVASKTVEACDKNSAENAKTMQPVNSVISKVTTVLHMNAAQKGAVEQCRNISLMSAAAGYGAGAIQKGCSEEINTCKQTCTSDVVAYADEDKIIEACQAKGGAGSDANSQAQLQTQASELAAVASAAKTECYTTSEELLKQVQSSVTEMTKASQAAAACEQSLASGTTTTPLTENCALYPNSAGCPVNCAYDTTSTQCKCLNNPNDPSCKGSGANVAAMANPNTSSPGLGGFNSNFKSSGAGGSTSLGGMDLDMGDSEKPVAEKKNESAPEGSAFAAAQSAQAGGGGGVGGSGSGKTEKGAEAHEDRGFLGGTFAAIKNAASSIFGGGSSTAKKPVAKDDPSKSGFKPSNSALRGLASNGKSCFVDAKGAEFCFGRKNMDIFKMMNTQYGNQYNTFLQEK